MVELIPLRGATQLRKIDRKPFLGELPQREAAGLMEGKGCFAREGPACG